MAKAIRKWCTWMLKRIVLFFLCYVENEVTFVVDSEMFGLLIC